MTLFACGQKGTSETTVPVTEVKKAPATTVPLFDADSAYAYVEKQVSFGYRVRTRQLIRLVAITYIELNVRKHKYTNKEATLNSYDGTPLESR